MKMEVVAGLIAERNMEINAGHGESPRFLIRSPQSHGFGCGGLLSVDRGLHSVRKDSNGADLLLNCFRVKMTFGVEFFLFAMFDEIIGDAEANDVCRVIMIGHEFNYRATESAHDTAVLDGDDFFES